MDLTDFKKFTGLNDEHIKVIKDFINKEKEYKPKGFWAKRPLQTDNSEGGEIWKPENIKKNIKQSPLNLPKKLEWKKLDPMNKQDMTSMSEFLNKHYMFKEGDDMGIHYSPELLSWYLSTPNEKKNPNIVMGVVIEGTTRLIGTITGVYFNGSFYNKVKNMLDVDLFCIHPKLRSKGLAEVMIDELVRQMNLRDVFHGTFSGSRNIPNQVCDLQFFHRPINTEKLVDTGFLNIKDGNKESAIKMFAINDDIDDNFREALEDDLESIYNILNKQLERYSVHFVFTKEQVKHLFFNDCVDTYVYETDDEVTEFISVYKIKYRVMNSNKEDNKFIHIGQLFYYAYNNTTLYELFKNLIVASEVKELDVINCLNDMDNNKIFDGLKFTEGSGKLKHYLYNWITPQLDPSQTAKHVI